MNTTKPGRPDYTGPNEGLALWVHHAEPVEYCYSFSERIAYILAGKPKDEQALRLTALTYLPTSDPKIETLKQAWKTYDQAREAYEQAQKAYDQARDVLTRARGVYDQAREAIAWRDLAAQYAPEVPYTETGELDFALFNRKDA